MARRHRPRAGLVLIPATFLLLIGGCQFVYPIELRGTIRSARDGAPVEGVEIKISLTESELVNPNSFPIVSAPDGTFSVRFEARDGAFNHGSGSDVAPWTLSLSKKGYRDEVVDLGRFKTPRGSEPMVIVVAAFMRQSE